MGVSSGRAQVADVAFRVFSRSVHPDWFSTRLCRRIAQARWEADVRIIEGGHAINFGAGAIRLTEVLSGPETLLPDPGLLFHSTVRCERTASLLPGGNVAYHACFEVERVDPEIFRHLNDEMLCDISHHNLVHSFKSGNRLVPPPLVHLHVEFQVRSLAVQSFHTFPDEYAIVRSQSLYELTAGSPKL
jgi:hypothetical protein